MPTPTTRKPVGKVTVLPPESPAPSVSLIVSKEIIDGARKESAAIATRTPKLLTITNDSQLAAADNYRSTVVKPALVALKSKLAPIRTNAAQLHRQVVALCDELLEPFVYADTQIKTAMEAHATRVLNQQRAEARRIEADRMTAALEAAVAEAQTLLADGNDSAAQDILDRVASGDIQPATSMPAVIPRAPTSANSSVRVLKRFNLLDASKLKREFLLPNMSAIQAIVSASGKAAEQIVGEGAIEYTEVANVSTRSS